MIKTAEHICEEPLLTKHPNNRRDNDSAEPCHPTNQPKLRKKIYHMPLNRLFTVVTADEERGEARASMIVG